MNLTHAIIKDKPVLLKTSCQSGGANFKIVKPQLSGLEVTVNYAINTSAQVICVTQTLTLARVALFKPSLFF